MLLAAGGALLRPVPAGAAAAIPHDLSPASDLKSAHATIVPPVFVACTLSDYWVLHPQELSVRRPGGQNRKGVSDEDDDHVPSPGVALPPGREREEEDIAREEVPRGPRLAVVVPDRSVDTAVARYRTRSGIRSVPDAVLPRRGSIPRDGTGPADPDPDRSAILAGDSRVPRTLSGNRPSVSTGGGFRAGTAA